jgi:hypothetical protein
MSGMKELNGSTFYTSLIQKFDLIANKPIKQAFKKRNISRKICYNPELTIENFLSWLKEKMEEVHV